VKDGVVQIGLIGHGTVGGGVVKLFQKNLPLLESKAGTKMRLAWVSSLERGTIPVIGGTRPAYTANWRQVVEDPSVDIVIELIGGLEPARTIILSALRAGKQVATANKAALSKHWMEIFTEAQHRRGLVYFEAAVGGGIPVIQGLNEGLAANRIQRIRGVVNGTTNYILTRMTEENMSFANALKAAQVAGFAEANPSFDIEGVDAAQKLAVLSSLSTTGWVRVSDVHREGLSGIDLWDLDFAKKRLGLTAKFVAMLDVVGDRFLARVHPTLIPETHPFANVRHEYNAIIIQGDFVKDVMFYGKGAGALPTASAVVSDVVYLARQVAGGIAGRMPYVTFDRSRRMRSLSWRDHSTRHYLRFNTADKPGVLASITKVLSRHGISIASVHQEDGPVAELDVVRRSVPVIIVTHEASEGAVDDARSAIRRLPGLSRRAVHLRVDSLR